MLPIKTQNIRAKSINLKLIRSRRLIQVTSLIQLVILNKVKRGEKNTSVMNQMIMLH